MTSTDTDLIHIDIALTDEEKALEKVQQSKPKIQLSVPADFEDDIAWELANLTRIAYKDIVIYFCLSKGR